MIALAECRRIIERVGAERQVHIDDILGRSRHMRVVKARVLAARTLFELGVPISEIARQLKRNHATVQYYLGRIHRDRPVLTRRSSWRIQA